MTRIVHCKKEKYDVMIDRTTKFGNPFKISPTRTREEAIALFRTHFYNHPELMKAAELELKDKVLGCWCKPSHACHGDIYVEFLEKE